MSAEQNTSESMAQSQQQTPAASVNTAKNLTTRTFVTLITKITIVNRKLMAMFVTTATISRCVSTDNQSNGLHTTLYYGSLKQPHVSVVNDNHQQAKKKKKKKNLNVSVV
jgi:hypothetical protein